jgi:hypothetical protein
MAERGYRRRRRPALAPHSRAPFHQWNNARCYVQCVANTTTALASKSHEIMNPANMRQPRAFDIAPRSTNSIRLGSTSCPVGCSTGEFDVRDGASGPIPMVEEATPHLGLAIGAGRAFLCLGLGGRRFFIAYSCSLTIAAYGVIPCNHRAVCATGRRLYFRNRSLAASIIRAWTVVSRSRAS